MTFVLFLLLCPPDNLLLRYCAAELFWSTASAQLPPPTHLYPPLTPYIILSSLSLPSPYLPQLRFFSKYAPIGPDTQGVHLNEDRYSSFLPQKFESKKIRVRGREREREEGREGGREGGRFLSRHNPINMNPINMASKTPSDTRLQPVPVSRRSSALFSGCKSSTVLKYVYSVGHPLRCCVPASRGPSRTPYLVAISCFSAPLSAASLFRVRTFPSSCRVICTFNGHERFFPHET